MNELILDISFIRACLFKAGSERTRKILEADLQKLEEERDQIMRNFAAHLKELRKQRLRRRWPRCTITTLNQLRRARGYNLWMQQMDLWMHYRSHQMTGKEKLEMYWMEQSAEIRKKFKKRRCKRCKRW
eukprot:TRINITY_DN2228_c1_g1_i1.p1 TRINITY_DN2228_c1_g1~~TRINITY_DN2228_c1_g1_i1.p1  ORF type:complete len:129 (-),score=27.42 TRINITY_DN2228_c1_g1_i1:389-775(-)